MSPQRRSTGGVGRDPHAGPVPEAAWQLDRDTRRRTGRVQIFSTTRPGGLDGWTMDAGQYQAVHDLILDIIDDDDDADDAVALQHVVETVQARLGDRPVPGVRRQAGRRRPPAAHRLTRS